MGFAPNQHTDLCTHTSILGAARRRPPRTCSTSHSLRAQPSIRAVYPSRDADENAGCHAMRSARHSSSLRGRRAGQGGQGWTGGAKGGAGCFGDDRWTRGLRAAAGRGQGVAARADAARGRCDARAIRDKRRVERRCSVADCRAQPCSLRPPGMGSAGPTWQRRGLSRRRGLPPSCQRSAARLSPCRGSGAVRKYA